jgi:hypothetical protein
MLVLPSFLFADEFDFGLAITPMDVLKTEEDRIRDQTMDNAGLLGDFVLGFHAGYSFAWLFYASVDANAMPPWWVERQTASIDAEGNRLPGILQPGFVSFLDVGIRPTFGSLSVLAELGMNHFYIRGGGDNASKMGVNFRLGAGYFLSAFSINIIGTIIFSDFDTMAYIFEHIEEDWAKDMMGQSVIPSIALYLHL